ncbi:MAG: hypothetical protein HYZ25_18345 [Chloroflexi bacterium]|nr:hypothetical protein [Chloroflexota bacterium]
MSHVFDSPFNYIPAIFIYMTYKFMVIFFGIRMMLTVHKIKNIALALAGFLSPTLVTFAWLIDVGTKFDINFTWFIYSPVALLLDFSIVGLIRVFLERSSSDKTG